MKTNIQTCLLSNVHENKPFVPKINTANQDNSLTTLGIIFFLLIPNVQVCPDKR